MTQKTSVIIPVYNTKKYLQQAVDSILIQKDDLLEVIIINDGSTDGSGELLEQLYGNNKIIKILHTENQGQGLARNLGTTHSIGDYIYYFDSDDIAAPDLLEKFNTLLKHQPEVELFCFSGESFLDKDYSSEKFNKHTLLSTSTYKRKMTVSCDTGEDAFKLLVEYKAFIPGPPLYILKKSILTTNNIKFNSIRYEDEEFTHKLFLYAKQTYITNDVLFNRRVREGSTMQSEKKFTDISGYFETIQTLSELKELKFLKPITKEVIEDRISTFIRMTIEMKASKRFNLTNVQKKIFKDFLQPYISQNLSLKIYYYQYPLEYKLRALKQQIFN